MLGPPRQPFRVRIKEPSNEATRAVASHHSFELIDREWLYHGGGVIRSTMPEKSGNPADGPEAKGSPPIVRLRPDLGQCEDRERHVGDSLTRLDLDPEEVSTLDGQF